jgi:hypothetical protein
MRALRATAEAMRAWPTEIVERECVSVTPSVRASKLVGRRGQDGRRCFTEKCPTKLVLVPQLRHHQAVVGAGLKRDGTCRSGVQCPTSWDRSGRTGRDTLFYRAFRGKSRHRATRLSSLLTRSAISVSREKSGPDTFLMGRDRRQTRAARSVGRAASLPAPVPDSEAQ